MRTAASVRRVQYSASMWIDQPFIPTLTNRRSKKNEGEKRGNKLTPPIPTNPIDKLILTNLIQRPITRLTRPIMRAMPASAHTVSYFPFLLAVADRDNGADDFVPWDAREGRGVAKGALLQEGVGVADSACVHFNEDFAGLGVVDGDVFDCPWCTGLFDDDGAAG